jgi:hypothetical protein
MLSTDDMGYRFEKLVNNFIENIAIWEYTCG